MIRVLLGNVLINASGAIAPAIALSILLRRVGFAELGHVLACQTLVALFVGVSDLGCSIRGLQRVAHRHHTRSIASTGRSLQLFLSFRYTSTVIATCVLLAYQLLFKRADASLIAPTIALFLCQSLAPSWALLALESTGMIAAPVIAVRALWLAATVTFVHDGLTYLWLTVFLNLCIAAISVRAVNRTLGISFRVAARMPPRRYWRALRSNATFSLSRVSVNVYQSTPLLALTHIATPVAAGIYGTIEAIHKVFATASYPVTDALFSRTSRTRSPKAFVRYGIPLLCLIYFGILMVALRAEWTLSIVGGGKAAGAAPQLRLILVATAFAVTSLFVGYPLAGGLGRTQAVNRTTFVSPFALAVTMFFAYWGTRDALWSAIIGLIGTEAAVLVLRLVVVRTAITSAETGSEVAPVHALGSPPRCSTALEGCVHSASPTRRVVR